MEAEGGGAALVLLFLVALLSLVDEIFAASQHEVHPPCELVCYGGVSPAVLNSKPDFAAKREDAIAGP